MQKEIYISIVPTSKGTEYIAQVYERQEKKLVLFADSMRSLLLKIKADKNLSNARIIGDFSESEMTEDDKIAWETPLHKLSKE